MSEELKQNLNQENKNEGEKKEGSSEEQKPKKKIRFGTGAIVSIFSVSVVGLLGIGYFYTWPNMQKVEQADRDIKAKEDEISAKNNELASLKADNEKIANMSEEELMLHLTDEEKELRKTLPTSVNVPNLIRDMDEYSKVGQENPENDVNLSTFSLSEPKADKDNGLYIVPINASLSSHSFALMDYLKVLESAEHRIINVKSITISYSGRQFNDKTKIEIFKSDSLNNEYQLLLNKRSFYLLTNKENERLKELQQMIFEEFERLRKETLTDEADIDYLAALQTEVNTIQNEVRYNINMETYFNMSEQTLNEMQSAEAAKTAPTTK